MIDESLIREAANGDVSSFEKIFKTHADFVFNVSLRIVGSREDAEEVSQEVFLKVYDKLQSFRSESKLKTWIYRITVNMAINHSKKESKKVKANVPYDETDVVCESKDSVDVNLKQKHHQGLIKRLLDALTPDQRACIVLRSIDGLSYEQIAGTLNININAVRSRIKRARLKLLSMRKEVDDEV